MKKTLLLMLCLMPLFKCASAASATTLVGAEVFITSQNQVQFAWDAGSGAVGYEMRLVMFDKTPLTYFNVWEGTALGATITFPRSGHFHVEMRSWNWKDQSTNTKQYSGWIKSTDSSHAVHEGKAMGWWIYNKLAAPGGPVIE